LNFEKKEIILKYNEALGASLVLLALASFLALAIEVQNNLPFFLGGVILGLGLCWSFTRIGEEAEWGLSVAVLLIMYFTMKNGMPKFNSESFTFDLGSLIGACALIPLGYFFERTKI
jgi:hypothetical protein